MPPSRFRIVWPVLCVVLVAALIGNTQHWRKKLRASAAEPARKVRPKPYFDKRDSAYFEALAAASNYGTGQPLKAGDAARLAAYDRIELNKYAALARGGEPITFPTHDPGFTRHIPVPLAATMSATLDAPCAHYRWELINKSDRTLPAPIVYQEDRWDSAEALVAQAGFTSIPDETDRALAIWRYVCARRVSGDPPTQGREEHDVLKFLGSYGYGFSDDTARAVTTLAEVSGLRGRIWALDGHVVSEVFADGRWRMFDADQEAYMHRADAPRGILGVEDLTDLQAFAHFVSLRGANEYPRRYADCILTRENNQLDDHGTHTHRLQPTLRAGERITLTNYNWGRYFLGKYPLPPPRFYNGFFTYTFHPKHLASLAGKITAEAIEGGHRLSNTGSENAIAQLDFAYPFPIVGGKIASAATMKGGHAAVRVEERDHDRITHADLARGLNIDLDRFVGVLANAPTYRYALILTLQPGTVVELRGLEVRSDFQFARLPLLTLQPGANSLRAYFPEGTDPAAFELVISTK